MNELVKFSKYVIFIFDYRRCVNFIKYRNGIPEATKIGVVLTLLFYCVYNILLYVSMENKTVFSFKISRNICRELILRLILKNIKFAVIP